MAEIWANDKHIDQWTRNDLPTKGDKIPVTYEGKPEDAEVLGISEYWSKTGDKVTRIEVKLPPTYEIHVI